MSEIGNGGGFYRPIVDGQCFYRGLEPLDLDALRLMCLDGVAFVECVIEALIGHDLPRRGQIAQAGGQVGGGANHGILHTLVRAEQPGQNGTATKADADIEAGVARLGAHLVQALDAFAYLNGALHGMKAVLGVRLRAAEYQHGAVPDVFVDVTVVLVAGVSEFGEIEVQDLSDFLWVATFAERGIADQVDKHDAGVHPLAFLFELYVILRHVAGGDRVADEAGKQPFHALLFLQPGSHGVEGFGQVAEFAPVIASDPESIMAGFNGPCTGDQVPHRFRQGLPKPNGDQSNG